MFKCIRDFKFAIAIGAVLCVSVIICFCAFSFSGKKIAFEAEYYFVCYRVTDKRISRVRFRVRYPYGGAGYILNHAKKKLLHNCFVYYNKTECGHGMHKSQKGTRFGLTVLKISTKNLN